MNSEFRAHVAGLNTTDKKIKLTLELDAEINPNALFSVHQMVGEKVIVNMGSPQMSMNFDEPENEEMHLEQPAAEGETVIEGEFTVVTEDQEKKEQERDNTEQGPTEKEIEEYILSGKAPIFEDIKFDFPELLHKKQKLGSWKKVAMQTGDSIGQLTREYKAYKARVAEQMRDGDTA